MQGKPIWAYFLSFPFLCFPCYLMKTVLGELFAPSIYWCLLFQRYLLEISITSFLYILEGNISIVPKCRGTTGCGAQCLITPKMVIPVVTGNVSVAATTDVHAQQSVTLLLVRIRHSAQTKTTTNELTKAAARCHRIVSSIKLRNQNIRSAKVWQLGGIRTLMMIVN
jgi:hypothetical protein